MSANNPLSPPLTPPNSALHGLSARSKFLVVRISNRGSLLEKRGSRIQGQPYLYSPLPFPDSGMLLMWIGGSQSYVTQSRPLARMTG